MILMDEFCLKHPSFNLFPKIIVVSVLAGFYYSLVGTLMILRYSCAVFFPDVVF
jgi:hypothetical protein